MNKFFSKRMLVTIVLVFIALMSFLSLIHSFNEYRQGRAVYEELQNISNSPSSSQNKDTDLINEVALKEINYNYKLWLKINNTNINYPVVQGNDNSYYLTHDFKLNENKVGTIFIDYKNEINLDKNLIIYGHNMKDGSMFYDLMKYKDEEFFKANPKIIIILNNHKYTYEIFSVYTVKSTYDYIKTTFKSNDDYKSYLDDAKNNSIFKSNIEINSNDKILTLSTCSYEFNDARTVIHAKMVE